MYFMIKYENFFDKCMIIWEKLSNIIKNEFNSKPIDDKKYLKDKKKFNAKASFEYRLIQFIEKMKTIIVKCF